MRRGIVILILCLLMLGAGIGILGFGPGRPVPALHSVHANRLGAMALFACAAAMGIVGMGSIHMARSRLTWELRKLIGGEAAAQGALSPFGTPRAAFPRLRSEHPDLAVLVEAVNAVMQNAEQAIGAAHLRAKELEIQLKVISAEREHLEAIIYSISDAVLVTDQFDEVVLANDSAARLFDAGKLSDGRGDAACAPRHADASSRVSVELLPPELAKLIRDMRQSDSRGGRRIVELKLTGVGGERIYKVTLSCIRSSECGVPNAEPGTRTTQHSSLGAQYSAAGVVAVLHDMTREREVAQMKNDFVSNVSHELRTPLASIKAYAEMLIDGEAADEKTAQEFYEVIHNEANRLGRLIDNILNISRIESGLVKINKQPQSLMMILKEGLEVIRPQAQQKNIGIEEQISPAFYQTLIDRDMLYEACLNLMSNAVKYTPEGGTISVQTLVDESKKTVTVRITDNGVGIPQKDLPFIFDKFYRSEANSRMAKGTGLGLSLVKHIVETVHHGRILVESQVGTGSTFGFELELVP